jgi:hypothetical protein
VGKWRDDPGVNATGRRRQIGVVEEEFRFRDSLADAADEA